MKNMATGLLEVRVIRGVNLAVRDIARRSSDPYVTLTLGHQKVKTRVVHQSCHPEWNDQLTLCASNSEHTVHLTVFDHDMFSVDDEMGNAEIDIRPYLECYNNLNTTILNEVGKPQEDALISTVQPTDQNCLAGESCILWRKDRLVQEMSLVLKNVECGEIHVQVELKGGGGGQELSGVHVE
ncbi:hypothetical protein QQ045_016638 [Rhodiola kirilowii]